MLVVHYLILAFTVYVTRTIASTVYGPASSQQLVSEFGTSNDIDVVQQILQIALLQQ